MSIFDRDINKLNKIDKAIMRLQSFEPVEGYYLSFSGGKDSVVIKHLVLLANVKADWHYNVTTVDPPQLVRFIRENHKDVEFHYPKKSMWQLIIDKYLPPTRVARYCCSELKERGGEGRFVVTGVRWAESSRRKNSRKSVEIATKSKSKKNIERLEIFLNSDNSDKRKMIENCFQKNKKVLNPIVDWSDSEVWEFIRYFKLPYCELYDMGFKRIGCLGCPLSSNAREELERFPKYKQAYLNTFEKMLEKRRKEGKETQWKSAQEVLDWWLPRKRVKKKSKSGSKNLLLFY